MAPGFVGSFPRAARIEGFMSVELLTELAKAKAIFQQSSIRWVITGEPLKGIETVDCSVYAHQEPLPPKELTHD